MDDPDAELVAVIQWLNLRNPTAVTRISTAMQQRIVVLLQAQAARIVALEAEVTTYLYPAEGDADADGIHTAADAVAAITDITNLWEHNRCR